MALANFNSHTRIRCDTENDGWVCILKDFNSRICMRYDDNWRYSFYLKSIISIHAPVLGATTYIFLCNKMHLFQFTHPYKVRLAEILDRAPEIKFQFTYPYKIRLRMKFVFIAVFKFFCLIFFDKGLYCLINIDLF